MVEQRNTPNRPVNPRRRKPTPMQIFKERYLPLILLAVAAVLILIIITGSIVRAVQRSQIAEEASIAASEEAVRVQNEALSISEDAKRLAADYDYPTALALIDGFSGKLADFPELAKLRSEYAAADANLVEWETPSSVPHLSFQMLVVDPIRAFSDAEYGESIKKNYITTSEFSAIISQLYENGYILVELQDFVTSTTDVVGNEIYVPQPIRLPSGKKPIILTQTNVNYDAYLVDGDDDGYADKDGSGYACKLILDAEGNLVSEYIDANGETLTGNYDLIPILEAFISEHPDFSYRGARATIALTGHEGLFGYRTTQDHLEFYGETIHAQEVAGATAVAQVLRDKGYNLAYYTYDNSPYGNRSASEIQADLDLWNQEVTPIIGEVDTIAFAQRSDITEGLVYMGDKHTVLQDAGFVYYLGFCPDGEPWGIVVDDYARQGRILIGGSVLRNNADWFTGMFDAASVIDSNARDS